MAPARKQLPKAAPPSGPGCRAINEARIRCATRNRNERHDSCRGHPVLTSCSETRECPQRRGHLDGMNVSSWPGSGLSTLSYRAMGLVRENATSFFMQRILFLQLSHSPWLHSKDLHSNSHCESSGGVFATKGPLTKFLNPSNGLAIPTPS